MPFSSKISLIKNMCAYYDPIPSIIYPEKQALAHSGFSVQGCLGRCITTCICAAGQNRLHSASSPGSELSRLRNDSINGVWKSGRFYPVHNYGANSKLALIWLVCSLCLDQSSEEIQLISSGCYGREPGCPGSILPCLFFLLDFFLGLCLSIQHAI